MKMYKIRDVDSFCTSGINNHVNRHIANYINGREFGLPTGISDRLYFGGVGWVSPGHAKIEGISVMAPWFTQEEIAEHLVEVDNPEAKYVVIMRSHPDHEGHMLKERGSFMFTLNDAEDLAEASLAAMPDRGQCLVVKVVSQLSMTKEVKRVEF